jgi:hypothetical protein
MAHVMVCFSILTVKQLPDWTPAIPTIAVDTGQSEHTAEKTS